MIIIFKGQPLSTQGIYKYACRGHFPTMYMTKEGKMMKETYRWEVRDQYKEEVSSADCDVKIDLYFKDKRKRDVDNYNKLVLDALEGIVYEDDKQIQKLTVEKHISLSDPRVEVEINFKSI